MKFDIIPYQAFSMVADTEARIKESFLVYYASDFCPEVQLQSKIYHMMHLFAISGRRTDEHFKRIFKFSKDGLRIDWKISLQACKALLLRNYVSNPIVYAYLVNDLNEADISESCPEIEDCRKYFTVPDKGHVGSPLQS
jgi:hypothetical protein